MVKLIAGATRSGSFLANLASIVVAALLIVVYGLSLYRRFNVELFAGTMVLVTVAALNIHSYLSSTPERRFGFARPESTRIFRTAFFAHLIVAVSGIAVYALLCFLSAAPSLSFDGWSIERLFELQFRLIDLPFLLITNTARLLIHPRTLEFDYSAAPGLTLILSNIVGVLAGGVAWATSAVWAVGAVRTNGWPSPLYRIAELSAQIAAAILSLFFTAILAISANLGSTPCNTREFHTMPIDPTSLRLHEIECIIEDKHATTFQRPYGYGGTKGNPTYTVHGFRTTPAPGRVAIVLIFGVASICLTIFAARRFAKKRARLRWAIVFYVPLVTAAIFWTAVTVSWTQIAP